MNSVASPGLIPAASQSMTICQTLSAITDGSS
jgi:hypothetical protein